MTAPRDVIVVGGGVMGCHIALVLADAGLRTCVLERSVPGAEASTSAAGMLAAAVEGKPGPALTLGVQSREMHAELAERLRADHGIDVGFRRCGVMRVVFDEADIPALDEEVEALRRAGVQARRRDGDAARALEPELSSEVGAAVELPDEAQLEPPALLRGLAIAAERAGVEFRSGSHVQRLLIDRGRARGVVFDGGDTMEAAHVVVAAGSWTTHVGGVGLAPGTIHPVRGQVVATDARPPVLRRIVFGAGGYAVARPDGRTLLGSTEERVGFQRDPTLDGVRSIIDIGCRLVPSLASAPPRGMWAGFRPGTPDGLPLVGPGHVPGSLLASGHFRNGILLAPVTGCIVRDAILERTPVPEASALDPRRFAPSGSEEADRE